MKRETKKISNREKAFIAVAVVAVIFSVFVLVNSKQAEIVSNVERASIQDVSTLGFVAVTPSAEVIDERGVVALTANCYSVVAGTDVNQAESISNGIRKVTGERPNTHEIMRDIFQALDIELVMVKITELKGDNYIGRMIIQQGNTILSLDSRPSDGIALALRTNSTIYFNETMLKERGEKVC
jgi:bifunctional DNase/RNase